METQVPMKRALAIAGAIAALLLLWALLARPSFLNFRGNTTMNFELYEPGKTVMDIAWTPGSSPGVLTPALATFFQSLDAELKKQLSPGGAITSADFTDLGNRLFLLEVSARGGDRWKLYFHVLTPDLLDADPSAEAHLWIATLFRGQDSSAIVGNEKPFKDIWQSVAPLLQAAADKAAPAPLKITVKK
jgi:hypothetical protein